MSQKSAGTLDFERDFTKDGRTNRSRHVASRFLIFLLLGNLARDVRGYSVDISKAGMEGYTVDNMVSWLKVSRRHVFRVFQKLRALGFVKSYNSRNYSRGRPRKLLILTQKGRRKAAKILAKGKSSIHELANVKRYEFGITPLANRKTPEHYGFPEFQARSLPIVYNRVLWCPLDELTLILGSFGVDWKLCTKCEYKRTRIGDYVVCNHPENVGIYVKAFGTHIGKRIRR